MSFSSKFINLFLTIAPILIIIVISTLIISFAAGCTTKKEIIEDPKQNDGNNDNNNDNSNGNNGDKLPCGSLAIIGLDEKDTLNKSIKIALENDIVHIKVLENSLGLDVGKKDEISYEYGKYDESASITKKIFKASIACPKKTGLIIANPLGKASKNAPKSLIKYFIEKEDDIENYDGSATLLIHPEGGSGKLISIWGSKIKKGNFILSDKLTENFGFPIIKLPWITSSDPSTMHKKTELISRGADLHIDDHIKISFVCESKFAKFNKNTIIAEDKNPTFDDGHRMICYLITSHDFKRKGTWAKEVIKKSPNANSIDFNIRWFNMNAEEPANFLLGEQKKGDFEIDKIAEITNETLKTMSDKYIDGSKKFRISIVDMATFGETGIAPVVKPLTFSECFLKEIITYHNNNSDESPFQESLFTLFQGSFEMCEGLVFDEKQIDFPKLKKEFETKLKEELNLAWPTDLIYSDHDFCMNSIGKINICEKYKPKNIAISNAHIKFQQCFLKDLKESSHKKYRNLQKTYDKCILENNVEENRLAIHSLNTSYKSTCSLTSLLSGPKTECFSFSDYEFCTLFQNNKATCTPYKTPVEKSKNFIDDKFSVCYATLLTQGNLLRTLETSSYTSKSTDEENYNFCKNLNTNENNYTTLKRKIDEIINNDLCLEKNGCQLGNLNSNSAYTLCESIKKIDDTLDCDKYQSATDIVLVAENKRQSEFETCYIDHFITTSFYELDEQKFVDCKKNNNGNVLANNDINFTKLKEAFDLECKNNPKCLASTTKRFVDVRHFCELVTNFSDLQTCKHYAEIQNHNDRLTTLRTWEKSTYTDCFNTYLIEDKLNKFLNGEPVPLNPPSVDVNPAGNNDFSGKLSECKTSPLFKNLDRSSELDLDYTYTDFDKKCKNDHFCLAEWAGKTEDNANKYYFCTLLNTAFGHSSSEILNTCKEHDTNDLYLTESKNKLKECYLEKIYPPSNEQIKFEKCRSKSATTSFLDNTAVDFEDLQTSFKEKCVADDAKCPEDYNDQNKLAFCLHTTEISNKDKNKENISFCKSKFDKDGSLWVAYVPKKLKKDQQNCVVNSAATYKSWNPRRLRERIPNDCNGKSPYDGILDADFFTGMAQKIKDKTAEKRSYIWPPNLEYNDYDVCMDVFEDKIKCGRYTITDVDAIAKEKSNERIRSKYLVLNGRDYAQFDVKEENTRDFMISNHKSYLNWCEIKKDAGDECQHNTLEYMSGLPAEIKDLLPKGALFKEIGSFIAMDEGDINTLTPSSNNPGEQPLEIVDITKQTTAGQLEIKITSDATTNITTIQIKKSSIVASNENPVTMSGGVPVFSVSVPSGNPTKNGLIWAKESSKSDYPWGCTSNSWWHNCDLKEESIVNGFEDMHFEGHNIYDDGNPFLLERIFDDDDEVSNSVWAFNKRNSAKILFLHGIIHPADKDYENGIFLKCLSPEITAFSIESLEKTADYYSYHPQQQTTEDVANPKLTDGASSMKCSIHSTIDGSDIEKWTVNYEDETPYEKRMITDVSTENDNFSDQFYDNSTKAVYLDMAFGAITTDQRIYDWSVQIQQGLSEDELDLLKTQHNHHFQKVRVEIVDNFR